MKVRNRYPNIRRRLFLFSFSISILVVTFDPVSAGFAFCQWHGKNDFNPLTTQKQPLRHNSQQLLSTRTFTTFLALAIDRKCEESMTSSSMIPKHVAFICDGNSRWAKSRHLPTAVGHLNGADRLVDLLEVLRGDGVEYCTLYGFSTENWNRPKNEIDEIFRTMEQTARRLSTRPDIEKRVRFKILGDLEDKRIPRGLREILRRLEQKTDLDGKQQSGLAAPLTVCLAVNYGGRQDIVQATKQLALDIVEEKLDASTITESVFESYLSTHNIPDPDMIVRTSGEFRLSNFLLWNCAYSELYMTDVLWPDFDQECWRDALNWFNQRQRRFGSRDVEGSNESTMHGTTSTNAEVSSFR